MVQVTLGLNVQISSKFGQIWTKMSKFHVHLIRYITVLQRSSAVEWRICFRGIGCMGHQSIYIGDGVLSKKLICHPPRLGDTGSFFFTLFFPYTHHRSSLGLYTVQKALAVP